MEEEEEQGGDGRGKGEGGGKEKQRVSGKREGIKGGVAGMAGKYYAVS